MILSAKITLNLLMFATAHGGARLSALLRQAAELGDLGSAVPADGSVVVL